MASDDHAGNIPPSRPVGEGRQPRVSVAEGVRGQRKTKRDLLPSDTTLRSRALRQNATSPERKLRRPLREAFPTARFRFQVPFDSGGDIPYHADFCSHGAKLSVEIDGDTHVEAEEKDARRTSALNSQGYRVVRFTNADVMRNLEGVVEAIAVGLEGTGN